MTGRSPVVVCADWIALLHFTFLGLPSGPTVSGQSSFVKSFSCPVALRSWLGRLLARRRDHESMANRLE